MVNNRQANRKVIDLEAYRNSSGDRRETAAAPRESRSVVNRIVELKKDWWMVGRAMRALPSWVTPNGVTYFRALLLIPIIYLLRGEAYWPALGVLAFSMFLDFVDGALAEARNMKSEFGAFLDPLVDKIVVCGVFLTLADHVPQWMVMPFTGICLVAVALTMVRIIKMAKSKHQRQWAENNGIDEAAAVAGRSSVAAKPAGKMKMITEVVSIFVLVIGLGTASSPIILIAGILVLLALFLGLLSLKSQLFG